MIEAEETLTGSINAQGSLSGKVDNGIVVLDEIDPTVPSHVKNITKEDIDNWNKGKSYTPGENINITDDGVISVLTAPNVEKDNTKPITSAAVYTEVGNINVLLQTI